MVTPPVPDAPPQEDATHELTTLLECGPACSCSPACTARTTQLPAPPEALQLVPLPGKVETRGYAPRLRPPRALIRRLT